jgi:hypothetical protein
LSQTVFHVQFDPIIVLFLEGGLVTTTADSLLVKAKMARRP